MALFTLKSENAASRRVWLQNYAAILHILDLLYDVYMDKRRSTAFEYFLSDTKKAR